MYEYPVTEEKLNAKIVLLWAHLSGIQIEMPIIEKDIARMEEDPEANKEELNYLKQAHRMGENDITFLKKEFFDLLHDQENKEVKKEESINEMLMNEDLWPYPSLFY